MQQLRKPIDAMGCVLVVYKQSLQNPKIGRMLQREQEVASHSFVRRCGFIVFGLAAAPQL